MSYDTTITTTVHQAALNDINTTTTITGIQIPPLDATITYGAPLTISDGIGVLAYNKLQMITLLSDNLDATVLFKDATAGGGSTIKTVALIAGHAYEWDTAKSEVLLGSTTCLSIVITLAQTVNGQASELTTSNFHGRSSLSG